MITQCRFMTMALVGLSIVGQGVSAQGPGPAPTRIYTKGMAFKLPFKIDEADRADLQEVQLWVKNGPSDNWNRKETAPPTQANFTYRVTQDGEYWFSVVTVDRTGKATPSDVTQEPPGLIVVVDTQAPDFDVKPLALPTGEMALQCKVHDANPDYSKIKLEYQTDTGSQVLEAIADQQGVFRAPDPSLKGVVRATVTDRAGNTTTRDVNLKDNSGLAALDANATTGLVAIRTDKTPIETSPVTTTKVQAPSGGPTVQFVNSSHVSLEYKLEDVGSSGVGKVEIWLTRDEGQTWQRLCEDPDRHSPAEVDLPGEGMFGLSLVVSNGNGVGGNPPARGDTPDWWVEVDTTKPIAVIVSIRPGTGDDANTFLMNWTASDKNLKGEPIELYYATQHDGPWMPIAKGVKNTGTYRWPVPQGAGPEFFFRMVVSDRAGNTTVCEPPQSIVLDQSHPKAHVINVAASDPRLTPPNAH